MAIAIVSPRADWRDRYRTLAAQIRAVAPHGSRMHHIGSTAVPGLAAKDVVDLQLSVGTLETVDAAALAAVGFIERAGLRDHVPTGRVLAPEATAKRFFKNAQSPANLHVRCFGRFNQRFALLCRDYLRAHPAAAVAYEAFKRRLAVLTENDLDAYADAKDPVFDLIMVGAEDWAARIGWGEPRED